MCLVTHGLLLEYTLTDLQGTTESHTEVGVLPNSVCQFVYVIVRSPRVVQLCADKLEDRLRFVFSLLLALA